jgi:serine/threonine-protein kinase
MGLGCVGLIFLGGEGGASTAVPTVAANSALQTALAAGDAALRDDGVAAALASYDEARALAPDDPAVIERLALAYSAAGDYRQAEDLANQLIDTSASSEAQVAVGYAVLADALASQGNMVAAGEAAAEAVRIDPELGLGHAIQSNVLANRALAARSAPEMDEALDALGRAEDSMGDDSELLQALTYSALAYSFAQEFQLSDDRSYFEQSEESYERAIELLPSVALFPTNLAYLRLLDGEYDDARDGFEEALELDPAFASAQAGIGWSHYWEGDSAAAVEAFEAAVALDESQYDGFLGLGRVGFDAAFDPDSYAAAADQLRAAIERNPNNAEAYAYLGESLLFQGFGSEDGSDAQRTAYADSEAAYRAALERNDRYSFALSGLGWILQYQERYEESVAVFEDALELDEANRENHNGIAWSLYNLGRYDEAEVGFRAALALDAEYVSAHYGLGRTLDALGRSDEARAAYEATLALDPEYPGAQEALDALP